MGHRQHWALMTVLCFRRRGGWCSPGEGYIRKRLRRRVLLRRRPHVLRGRPMEAAGRNRLRLHIRRERQYGDGQWTAAVNGMGLAWTMRDRGRPAKPKAAGAVKA